MTTFSLCCTVCGNANPAQAAFCITCGEPLEASAPSPSNLTGLLLQDQLLKQRYRILAQIGRGGFAAVYKAEDLQFHHRLVAVKEMSQSGLNPKERAEAVEAFKHEAQMLASLQHPHLPRIYDHFSERGRWYLVMDFIEGETLEASLLHRPDGRLSLKETLDIGLQLCSVLDYLHTRRPPIIFRDLKPANILSVPPKYLYLIDFGIARHFKPGQIKDTMPFGSPGYAAPEQYGKAQTTPRSDIYSLGVLLHHLLSGSDPSEKPFLLPPLRLYGPEGLPELENLIIRMTELDPEQRPTSVAEVQAELHSIAACSLGNRVGSQPQRPPRDQIPATERPSDRERSAARQEQVFLPEAGRSRRRFVIGGLLTGAVLAVGAGSLLALLPKPRVPIPRPATTTTTDHAAPDVMFGFDAQHTRFNSSESILSPANVSHLMLAWLSPSIGGNIFSSPTVVRGSVYVGSYDGRLYALDAATGQTRWVSDQHGVTSVSNDSTPAVVNGVVYICLEDHKLYALDAVTGQLRWVSPASNALGSSPTVVNGVVYVTGNDRAYAFDAATGQTRWVSSPVDSNYSAPAVANGFVYVVTIGNAPGTGRVGALDVATGQTRWVSDLIDGGIDINSSPTVANGLVYIGSGKGGLTAFDAATGHTRWVTAPTTGSTGSSPAVAHGIVYITGDPVYAFDATTGEVRWVSDPIGAYNSDAPLVANGVIYVSSAGREGVYKGSVYALDATTGHTLWVSPPTEGQIFTTPAVANGVLYVASGDRDGKVYAFHLPHTMS